VLKASARPADAPAVTPVRRRLVPLVAVWLLGAPAAAEIYRWTDAQGKVHASSDLNGVPADQRDAAKASVGQQQGGAVMRIEARPPAKPAASPPTPAEAKTPPAAPPVSEESYGGRNEATWRAEAETYREAIARLEEQTDRCTAAEFRWSAGAGGRAYREESAEADACGRIQRELQLNRSWLETLEDSAHRAGVPPGWLRE